MPIECDGIPNPEKQTQIDGTKQLQRWGMLELLTTYHLLYRLIYQISFSIRSSAPTIMRKHLVGGEASFDCNLILALLCPTLARIQPFRYCSELLRKTSWTMFFVIQIGGCTEEVCA
jgi:hypothetical protein